MPERAPFVKAARRRRGALVAPDTPRSNPYWDDDSCSYDPSGSQAPALSRVPSNASNYSDASSTG